MFDVRIFQDKFAGVVEVDIFCFCLSVHLDLVFRVRSWDLAFILMMFLCVVGLRGKFMLVLVYLLHAVVSLAGGRFCCL